MAKNKLYTKWRKYFEKLDDEEIWWAAITLAEDNTLMNGDFEYTELSKDEQEWLGMAVIDLYYEKKLNEKDFTVVEDWQEDKKEEKEKMTLYKAIVTSKQTGVKEIIESEYNTKKDFIKDLRNNGYSVNDTKVKKADVFDAIIEYTDSSDMAFKICKTVADAENFEKVIDDVIDSKITEIEKEEKAEIKTKKVTKIYTIEEFKKLVKLESKQFEEHGGTFKKITGWFNLALGPHKAAKKMNLLEYDVVLKQEVKMDKRIEMLEEMGHYIMGDGDVLQELKEMEKEGYNCYYDNNTDKIVWVDYKEVM